MSRFLFVVPPLAGHVNPSLGVAQALVRAGHEVAWTGPELHLRPLLGQDATVFPTGTRLHRPQSDHGLAAVRSVWERFIVPFTKFSLPAVERAVAAYAPDVLVVDQHCPAGALVAYRHGLTWATLACSTIELTEPFRHLPKVEAWIEAKLTKLWAMAGLPEDEYADPRFSPHLVLATTTTALTGDQAFPEHFAMVGPTLAQRPDQPDFPWEWLDAEREHVLVSMGTLADDLAVGFHEHALEALAPLGDRLQAVFIAPPESLPDLPEHVLALARVPMLALLGHLDVVVSHGGLNTVCESLANGVPLVVAPIRHDQPINAAQVASAGVGLRIGFARASAEHVRSAVTAVLDDPAYRESARRVADSFADAGGADRAAEHLIDLADRQRPAHQHPPALAGPTGTRST